ncbi:transcriptional coactivator/pterin dehydratase [Scheffersomyces amazonensis]|uniref:transcriptional coactivator/pterin dehydratase n=1 Tax=Scheffersomyces amazonensis TaxID=1078765 RepID=UPI00315C5383
MSKVLARQVVLDQLKRINDAASIPRWSLTTNTSTSTNTNSQMLEAHYKLKNFKTTWKFLNSIATIAHDQKHHPTIETTYNKVRVTTTTHDVGNQITDRDVELASAVERAYTEYE